MLEFVRRSPATVANPDANSDVLFLDSAGVFYTKDSAGTLTVLGRGIVSIAKTGTAGLVDTYTITFSGGTTQTYTVTNGDDGRSIVSVARTSGTGAPGTTDTYTITYSEAPLTSTFTVYNGANGTGMPANAAPPAIAATSSVGTATGEYALEDHTHAGVTSFNGRQGVVTPQQSDYDAFFTTTAEAAAAAPVQSFNGRTGNITPQQADYDSFFTTPAEASAAAPVQSFNGRQGAITPQQADYDAFFTTPAEAAAAAPVQSVNGQTGNVTINVPLPLNANRVGLFTSTANSAAVQPFLTLTIPANRIVAGATYSFFIAGTQSQSAAATNVVFTVQVNGTTIATATIAGGTAAQTNRGLTAEGMLQFTAAGSGGQVMGGIQSIVTGIAANGQTNVAGVAVNTTAAVTITLTAQTSTANAANIIRVAAASISERA